MSAIRRGPRSSTRSTLSLPYARPAAKKSAWSISGLFSYINPLRSRSPEEDDSEEHEHEPVFKPQKEIKSPSAQSLSARGHQIAQDIPVNGRVPVPVLSSPAPSSHHAASPPLTPTSSIGFEQGDADPFAPSPSAAENIEKVAAYLYQKRDQPITSRETAGLVSLLQQSASPEPRFRFSSTTPATPQGTNNSNNASFTFASPSSTASIFNATPSSSPRKTLSKNPNGVYRWEGGGSARPLRTRNRYHSPAFGPSRSTPERLVLKDPSSQTTAEPRSEGKRRRVAEEAPSSSAGPSRSTRADMFSTPPPSSTRSSAPEPSPTRAAQAYPFPVSTPKLSPGPNGSGSKANGAPHAPSTPRLRTTIVPPKPSAPVVPSPLRQAWGQSSTSSPPSTKNNDSPPQRQTKAANFMTELIKEVTPPKRPDVSNPYQAASPVKITGAVARTRGKRLRATGKPAPPKQNGPTAADDGKKDKSEEKPKEKEYSAQEIIEATVPKGSKRSRPPAHFEKPSGSVSRSPDPFTSVPSLEQPDTSKRATVEDVEDEDDNKRASKKSKPSVNGTQTNGDSEWSYNAHKASQNGDAIEVDELTSDNTSSDSNKTSGNGSNALSNSSPRRPMFGSMKTNSAPKEPSKLRFSYQPDAGSSSPAPPSPVPVPPPVIASSMDPLAAAASPIPTPLFTPPPPASAFSSSKSYTSLLSPPQTPAASTEAVSSYFASVTPATKDVPTKEHSSKPTDARAAALLVPKDSLPSFSFPSAKSATPSAAAHSEAMNAAKALPVSALPTYTFSSPGASTSTLPPSSAPPKSFDWSGAGLKAPTSGASADGAWTCSTCSLSNAATATEKCTICEAPKPKLAPAPAVKGFDWSAAGMKAPAKGAGADGGWMCSTCLLPNPADATEKCSVCDTPR